VTPRAAAAASNWRGITRARYIGIGRYFVGRSNPDGLISGIGLSGVRSGLEFNLFEMAKGRV
jgi:hypothetical protein